MKDSNFFMDNITWFIAGIVAIMIVISIVLIIKIVRLKKEDNPDNKSNNQDKEQDQFSQLLANNIWEGSETAHQVTDKNEEKIKEIFNGVIINIDTFDFNIAINEEAIKERQKYHIDTNPLCIINTSGSTGTPKSVVLNHRSFFDFMAWSFETMPFTDNEVIGSLSPVVFDIYSFEYQDKYVYFLIMILLIDMNIRIHSGN